MLPYLAQGANSSLEDGAVLGTLLSHVKRKSQLKRALHNYETLRKKRGEAIVRETFNQVCASTRRGLIIVRAGTNANLLYLLLIVSDPTFTCQTETGKSSETRHCAKDRPGTHAVRSRAGGKYRGLPTTRLKSEGVLLTQVLGTAPKSNHGCMGTTPLQRQNMRCLY